MWLFHLLEYIFYYQNKTGCILLYHSFLYYDCVRASPFNITIFQLYAPTSSYDDSDVDEFYRELQSLVDQTPKQDILVVQGDWNAKVGEDAQEDWGEVCGPMTEGSSS